MVRFPKCKLGKTLSISKQTQIFNVSNGLAASTTVRHFGLMNTYVTKVSPFESLVWNCQTLNTSFVLCINLYWGPNWLWLFTILRNGSGIPPPQIKKIIRLPHVPSISTSFQESSYKFLTRWYRTPARLAQMFPRTDFISWRWCNQDTFSPSLVVLPEKIKGFWDAIAPWIQKTTLRPKCNPYSFYLCNSPSAKCGKRPNSEVMEAGSLPSGGRGRPILLKKQNAGFTMPRIKIISFMIHGRDGCTILTK